MLLTRLALSPQSSLYSEEGLGVTTLSTLYGGVLLSSMFLPPLLIQKLGCKWTIVVSMCCYVAFSLGNFYASWYGPRWGPGWLRGCAAALPVLGTCCLCFRTRSASPSSSHSPRAAPCHAVFPFFPP